MPDSVGPARAAEKCQSLERWHLAHPHGHQDAMRRLLGRDTAAIARRIGGISRRTVQSWRDLDEEHRGPGEVLEVAIAAALHLGRPVDEATAPLRALAEAFGFDLVERREAAGSLCAERATGELMRRCGEGIGTLTGALADGRITPAEMPEIVSALSVLVQSAQDALVAAESCAAAETERVREASRTSGPLRRVAS